MPALMYGTDLVLKVMDSCWTHFPLVAAEQIVAVLTVNVNHVGMYVENVTVLSHCLYK